MANKLVKMIREKPIDKDGPTKADVSELEVENWLKYGWRIKEEEAPKANKKRKVKD